MEKVKYEPKDNYDLKYKDIEDIQRLVYTLNGEDVIINKFLLARILDYTDNLYQEIIENNERI